MPKNESVLITGIAGFIGSNFANGFNKRFQRVQIIGIDDFSTSRRDDLPKLKNKSTFYEGSVTNGDLLEQIFSKHRPKYIFHFAALPRVAYSVEYPHKTTEVNVGGVVALLDFARKHGTKRFIFSSSSSVYGGAKNLPTTEKEQCGPKSPYAMQKYQGELWCSQFSALYELDTVCLRYFNVYGPGQHGDSPYSTVVSAWLEALFGFSGVRPRYEYRGHFSEGRLNAPSTISLAGSDPANEIVETRAYLEGDGKQSRDFCFVEDVVEANILAMISKRTFSGEAINIAGGNRISLREIHKLIESNTGLDLPLEKRPPRKGDVKHTQADLRKAHRLLDFRPKVKFEEGLKRTVEWFKKSRN